MLVIAHVTHPLGRARIVEAVRGRAVVQFCDTLDELRALAGQPRVRAVIAEPVDGHGRPIAPVVREIKSRLASIPVVAYCVVTNSLSREVVEMVRAGADNLLFFNAGDSISVVRAALVDAEGASAGLSAMSELAALIPESLHPIVEYCLVNSSRTLTVAELAIVHGLNRKTVSNRFAAVPLPPPGTFISWCRLLAAAHFLEEPGRPFERVALELDFPSAGALRGLLRRYLDLTPAELRVSGGVRHVLEDFKFAITHQAATGRVTGGGQRDGRELMAS